MKTTKFITVIAIFLFCQLFFSCQKEDEEDTNEYPVEFGLNVLNSNAVSLFKSATDNDLNKTEHIILTILTSTNQPTNYTSSKIKITNLYGSFYSEKLLLKAGCYKLTEFMLADSSGNIIYSAPLEGTTVGALVDQPLPIAFCVEKNKGLKVEVDIVSTISKTPEDFGIASFLMIDATGIKVPISIIDMESGEFISATVVVSNDDWNSYNFYPNSIPGVHGTIDVYKKTFYTTNKAQNILSLDDSYPTYYFQISKAGYTPYSESFTRDSLKKYSIPSDNGPLIIEMATTTIGEVTDIDGNKYPTIKIGTQIWMQENLKVLHYRDGSEIPNITDNTEWAAMSSGALWYDENYSNWGSDPLGAFYNWYAIADPRNVCPEGWHIPTMQEWAILIEFMGGVEIAGGKLKGGSWEPDQTFLASNNLGDYIDYYNNESGFTAISSGWRSVNGSFSDLDYCCFLWSSSFEELQPQVIYLSNNSFSAMNGIIGKNAGLSLRCIKD